jgi:hypothetical protein
MRKLGAKLSQEEVRNSMVGNEDKRRTVNNEKFSK